MMLNCRCSFMLKIVEIYFEPRQDDDELPRFLYLEDINLNSGATYLIFLHITKK